MKANEAPEKIYVHVRANKELGTTWHGKNITNSDIEYIRAHAFIEKACEYISEHVEYYMKKDKACNVPFCPLFATKSFIEDFRKYMKGE